MRKLPFIAFIALLCSLPISLAITKQIDLADMLKSAGELLSKILSNDYSLFFVVFIILLIVFKAIYQTLIGKLKLFEGGGGEGLNKSGELLSWTLSLLTTISFAYAKGERSAGDFVNSILGPFGIYGLIIFAAFLYLFFKRGLESNAWAYFLSGVSVFFISAELSKSNPNFGAGMAFGSIMVLSGLIWLIIRKLRERSARSIVHDEAAAERREQEVGQAAQQQLHVDRVAEQQARGAEQIAENEVQQANGLDARNRSIQRLLTQEESLAIDAHRNAQRAGG